MRPLQEKLKKDGIQLEFQERDYSRHQGFGGSEYFD
jgi:hypothetical protein